MADYISMFKSENNIHVSFNVEDAKILEIGEKMNDIHDEAYMNGYNWDAFLNYYFRKNDPDVLEGMEADPEAGMYAAFYPLAPENEQRAKKFVDAVRSLIEHEEELYRIVEENGDEIEWD